MFSAFLRLYVLLCLFMSPFTDSDAQPLRLEVRLVDSREKMPRYDKTHQDSLSLQQEMEAVSRFFQDKGYLKAEYLRVNEQERKVTVILSLGERFFWDELRTAGVPAAWWKAPPDLKGKYVSWAEVREWQAMLIRKAESQGFPFARVQLDSLEFDRNRLRACMNLQKGTAIRFDTLVYPTDQRQTEESLRLKKKFLMRFLGVRQNTPYNQAAVERIAQRIQGLPYVMLTDSVQVRFRNDRAYLFLPLRLPPTNRFDALIGVLPNEGESQRLTITGRAELELRNPFGSGKYIFLSWQRIRAETQQLELAYEHPDLLGTQLTPRIELNWLKEDTTFFSLRRYLRLSYPFFRIGTVGAVIELRTTRLLTAGFTGEEIDSDLWTYGLRWEGERTDRFFQPRRGWRWWLEAKAGNKQLSGNLALAPDSLRNQTPQLELRADLSRFLRLGRLSTLLVRAQAGWIENEQLFRNDLFRVGGLQSLRGFNENFFFADRYAVLTGEWRLLLDQSSYLFAFFDQARLRSRTGGTSWQDNPLGFGAGLRFSTSGGVFTFVYAMGRSEGQALGLTTANIHFGFVSRF